MNLLQKTTYFILVLSIIIFQSCGNDNNELFETVPEANVPGEELSSFSPSELDDMTNFLAEQGIVIAPDTAGLQTRGIFINDLAVSALKVSCKYPNPSGAPGYVDMSGVILVPKKTIFTGLVNHRLVIAPPPTYTGNEQAPSNLFKRVSLFSKNLDLNFLSFWCVQARLGYVVLIPDYLGFGDSYKQCFPPYIESKPMVGSILELTKAAQSVLSANGYRYKKEVIFTGYSQGGFVAASVTRELETSSKYDIPVNLLVTGGTPCYLDQIVDIVRASTTELTHTYFIPYAIWGYKMNGYPKINVGDILKEPYASQSLQYFDGTYKNVNNKFPAKARNLYTDKFINDLHTDPNLAYMSDILKENSLKPWKNKCKFIMTHGVNDVSVYYQNAADFSVDQKKAGGKVSFYPTIGTHVTGIIPYYLKASAYIQLNR